MSVPDSRISRIVLPYLIQNATLFKELPEEDVAFLRTYSEEQKAKRGKVLFRAGGYPKGVYWLIAGKVKIFQETPSGQTQTLYIYTDGDLLGYRQFIAQEKHPVSAVLLEDSTIRFIPAESFRHLLTNSLHFTRHLLTALSREFTVWMNRTAVYSVFPVRERIVLALLILHEQYSVSGKPIGEITITRTDLAAYVGASLETVVRILNKFKADGLVAIQGRRIDLLNTKKLIQLLEK